MKEKAREGVGFVFFFFLERGETGRREKGSVFFFFFSCGSGCSVKAPCSLKHQCKTGMRKVIKGRERYSHAFSKRVYTRRVNNEAGKRKKKKKRTSILRRCTFKAKETSQRGGMDVF